MSILSHLPPRRARLFDGIDLATQVGVEIGALTGPLVPRAGTRVWYADHLDTPGLRAKYAGHDVDPAAIVEVDVVWNDGTLRQALPAGVMLDYAVASHVIEHVPDVVGWLRQIAAVLRPGGRLCLVIPDKRFTFDRLREPSRLADAVDAFLRGNRQPAPGQVFDFHANIVQLDPATGQPPRDPALLRRHYTGAKSLDIARVAHAGTYVDVHVWVFTPESTLRLFADLIDLDLLDFACAQFDPTPDGAIDMQIVLTRLPDHADRAAARASFLAAIPPADAAARPDEALARLQATADALLAQIAALRRAL